MDVGAFPRASIEPILQTDLAVMLPVLSYISPVPPLLPCSLCLML